MAKKQAKTNIPPIPWYDKPTCTVRNTGATNTKIRDYMDSLPEENEPQNITQLVVHLLDKQAHPQQAVQKTTEQTPAPALEQTENTATVSKLMEENENLQKRLDALNDEMSLLEVKHQYRGSVIEQYQLALEREREAYKVIETQLLPQLDAFREETTKAFRHLFSDLQLRDLTATECLDIMLDYCQADPVTNLTALLTNNNITITPELETAIADMQFPRKEKAIAIYQTIKSKPHEPAAEKQQQPDENQPQQQPAETDTTGGAGNSKNG